MATTFINNRKVTNQEILTSHKILINIILLYLSNKLGSSEQIFVKTSFGRDALYSCMSWKIIIKSSPTWLRLVSNYSKCHKKEAGERFFLCLEAQFQEQFGH